MGLNALPKSAPGRDRTADLALRRHSLYPLSYRGVEGSGRKSRASGHRGIGGGEGDRTLDLRIANATLSQLSYSPLKGPRIVPANIRSCHAERRPGNADTIQKHEGLSNVEGRRTRPEFTLPDESGKDRSLTEFLIWAPRCCISIGEFQPDLRRSSRCLRDLQTELKHANLRVVGISAQTPASHAKFEAKTWSAVRPLIGRRQGRRADVWRQRTAGPQRPSDHICNRWQPPGSGPRCGGHPAWTPPRYRAQGDPDSWNRALIIQAQEIGAANARHGDDVHCAILIVGDPGQLFGAR